MDVVPPVPELTWTHDREKSDHMIAYCRVATKTDYTIGIFHAEGEHFGSCHYQTQDGSTAVLAGGGFWLIHAREASEACIPDAAQQKELAAELRFK